MAEVLYCSRDRIGFSDEDDVAASNGAVVLEQIDGIGVHNMHSKENLRCFLRFVISNCLPPMEAECVALFFGIQIAGVVAFLTVRSCWRFFCLSLLLPFSGLC